MNTSSALFMKLARIDKVPVPGDDLIDRETVLDAQCHNTILRRRWCRQYLDVLALEAQADGETWAGSGAGLGGGPRQDAAGVGSATALAASLTPLVARLRIHFLPGMYGSALMPWFCSQICRRLVGVNRLAFPVAICWLRGDEIPHALLIRPEGVAVAAVRGQQLAGQNVGPDQGEAAPLARQGRRAVAGVADEGDPPGRPAVHAYLAGGVKVKVGGLWHGGEQSGNFPAIPLEGGGQELSPPAAVTVVIVERVGGEEEGRPALVDCLERSRRSPTCPASR